MRHKTKCRNNSSWLHVRFTYKYSGFWVCKSTVCAHKTAQRDAQHQRRYDKFLIPQNIEVTWYYCKDLMQNDRIVSRTQALLRKRLPTLILISYKSHHSPPPLGQQTLAGHCLIIVQASRLHSDTPNSVGLLWTNDQPDAETTNNNHRHPCSRRDSNP